MLNKYSSVPLYTQLKDLIIEKIKSGEFPEDSKIPSEQELCEIYNISRPTVRQAINELTMKGILYKQKGKGTFVAKSKVLINVKDYTGFTDSILDSQFPGKKEIFSAVSVRLEDCDNLKNVFIYSDNPAQPQFFAEFKYISKFNDEVYSLNTSYVVQSFFPEIIEDVKAGKPSYEILKGKYPYIPVKSRSSLEIIYTGREEAQILHLPEGQPLILIETVLYSKSGRAVEYVISKYRADKCKFCFENVK